jgi:inner membrane protein
MATVFTHAIASLALGKTFTREGMPFQFWALLTVCSILPDLDVISFFFGLRYGDVWGHRGFSHSLLFAFLLSFLVLVLGFKDWGRFSRRWWRLWVFFFLVISTHGLLDAITDGGLGVAFFSPFDNSRYFLPWTPLKVSPIGLGGFFSPWGREVIKSEIVWVWIPTIFLWAAVKGRQKVLDL